MQAYPPLLPHTICILPSIRSKVGSLRINRITTEASWWHKPISRRALASHFCNDHFCNDRFTVKGLFGR